MAERRRFKHLAQGSRAYRGMVEANLWPWGGTDTTVDLPQQVTVTHLGEQGTWHMPRGLRRPVLAAASLATAAAAIFYGGGPRVGEARGLVFQAEGQRTVEQIERIIETPQNISLVFWKADRVSVPSEAVAEFEKLKPALLVQSVWSYDEARGDWSNYTVGAPDFANLLKQIPKGETRLFVVANRRPIETPPVATATPTPRAGGSEKFPAPTQGSDTPPEARPRPITEAQVDAFTREMERLLVVGGFREDLLEPIPGSKAFLVRRGAGPIWPGLPNLRVDESLQRAAKWYAGFLRRTGQYDHELDGRTTTQRARDFGYRGDLVGEVLTSGDADEFQILEPPEDVLRGWFASPGHRAVITNPIKTDFAFGCAWSEQVGIDDRGGRHRSFSITCGGLFGRQQGK